MALKLGMGKCRLCLKLFGDFLSIFEVDNSIQLAEMAMDCAKIKIQEGDGLPDKVCAECVGKLSIAYIFKQQCERSDHELRRNNVPPPGCSASSRSDSAFSSAHTDISTNHIKLPPSTVSPANRCRKRSRSQSLDYNTVIRWKKKRPPSPTSMDSDFEDINVLNYSDSDEPPLSWFKCNQCPKEFRSQLSLRSHTNKVHCRNKRFNNNTVNIPGKNIVASQETPIRQPSPTSMDSDFEDTNVPKYSDSDEPPLPEFKCKQCPKEFMSLPSLRAHTNKVHCRNKRFDNNTVNIPGKNIIASQETTIRQPSLTSMDSDYEDTSMPNSLDSDEPPPPGFKCKQCPKEFRSLASLRSHTNKVHSKDKRFDNYILSGGTIPIASQQHSQASRLSCQHCDKSFKYPKTLKNHVVAMHGDINTELLDKTDGKNIVASQETPKSSLEPKPSRTSTGEAMGSEGKLSCDKCSKTFKLKIMLKCHQETCDKTPSSSLIKVPVTSLKSTEAALASPPKDEDLSKMIECGMCTTKFNTKENLEKHMRVVHTNNLKLSFLKFLADPRPSARVEKKMPVPCVYCGQSFDDYYLHGTHFSSCEKRDDSIPLECTVCHKVMNGRGPYAKHVKDVHFFAQEKDTSTESKDNFWSKKLPSQKSLISNMAARISNESGHSVAEDAVEVTASQHSQAFRASNGGTLTCRRCDKTFKYRKALANHIEAVHGDIETELLDKPYEVPSTSLNESFQKYSADPRPAAGVKKNIPVPCVYCGQSFDDYYQHGTHFSSCEKRNDSIPIECTVCHKVMNGRGPYAKHVKDIHFFVQEKDTSTESKENECKFWSKKLPSQKLLISHLATHISNQSDVAKDAVEVTASQHSQASRASNGGTVTCQHCDKTFKYPKSLANHVEAVHRDIKTELLDKTDEVPSTNLNESSKNVNYSYDSEYDSSAGEEDKTCDICEEQFSCKRMLIQHKETKHNLISGHKSAKINLKDCLVRCRICDTELKVSDINEHDQTHISKNITLRNQYSCAECQDKLKSCSSLANQLVDRLKQPQAMQMHNADVEDFCKAVVTETEPLESQEGRNGSLEVPLVAASSLSSNPWEKTMAALISLKTHPNGHKNVGNSSETASTRVCFGSNKVFDLSTIFAPLVADILDIKPEDLRAKFMEGVANVAALSLAIDYPTVASAPHSIANGFKNMLAIAAVTEVEFKEAETTKEYIKDPPPAAKEESEASDDDIDNGLFV